jgi:hypothetical protein
MTYQQTSPLYPLKGRIASNISRKKLRTITPPAGGQGENKCGNNYYNNLNGVE